MTDGQAGRRREPRPVDGAQNDLEGRYNGTMDRVTRAASTLVETLSDLGSPIASFLRPPRDRPSVELSLGWMRVGPAFDDLVSLYSWHDGVISQSEPELLPVFELDNVEHAVEKYVRFLSVAAFLPTALSPLDPVHFWSQDHFPIAKDWGGDELVIDLNTAHVIWKPTVGDPVGLFPNLADLFDTVTFLVRSSEWKLDDRYGFILPFPE